MNDQAYNNVKRYLNMGSPHHYKRPPLLAQGVPNVIGLNIREAIKMLEDAGLSVSFSGSGMVVGQSLPAGSKFDRGQHINLTLRTS